ncbi:MAG: DUF4115 domain-containing protein [Candidatus Omnitrophica bacterium]|nr:DUF4115 domain-containing protein [Candidatus Omnitrophota bacterium]
MPDEVIKSSDENDKALGQFLKKSRLTKGVTLDTVQEATKIPLDILKAIEEGYKTRAVSPFYFRQFYKMYAKYLNEDISSFMPTEERKPIPKMDHKVDDEFNLKSWMSDGTKRELIKLALIGLGAIIGLVFIFKFLMYVGHMITQHKPAAKVEMVREPRRVPVQEETSKEKHLAAAEKLRLAEEGEEKHVSKKKAAPQQSNIMKNITLVVRAKQKAWLEAKVDGSVVYQGNLRLGGTAAWVADDKIEISGNISSLDFEFNGNKVGPLSREERKAKKVVVTREGLSVTK